MLARPSFWVLLLGAGRWVGPPVERFQKNCGVVVVGRSFDKKIRRFSMQNLWFYCGERMGVGLEILLNHCSFGSHKS